MRRYRDLLAVPAVRRLTVALLLSRISTSMLNMALLVVFTQAYGYAQAGLLLMVYAFCNALAGPVRGRLADRRPPRTVMLALLAGHVCAYAGLLAALVMAAPAAVLAVTMALLGVTVPPTGPVVRGLWPTIVAPDRLPTAYAFDTALSTATFVAGPAVAGGLLLAFAPAVVVGATGTVKLVGDVLVAIAPSLRVAPADRPDGDAAGRLARVFGPLVNGRVRLLLGMVALDTFCFGCLDVGAVSAASGQGSAGVFTSLLALGGVVSGVAYGARGWPGGPRAQLVVLHGSCAAVLVAGAGATALGPVLVAGVFLAYGLVNGPVEILKQTLVGEVSSPGQRIEVFSWVFSLMWVGFGVGTTVAGRLAEAGGTGPPLLAGAAGQLAIVLVAVLSVAGLRRPATPEG